MDSPNDMSYLYQKFEEITNVHIEFTMVNMMDASTNFTLMISSGGLLRHHQRRTELLRHRRPGL